MPSSFVLLLVVCYCFDQVHFISGAALGKRRHENAQARNVKIINHTGRRIDAFWMNKFTADGVVTYHTNSEGGMGYAYGEDTSINSYIGHEFEIREMPKPGTEDECLLETGCRKTYIKVNSEEGQGTDEVFLWVFGFCSGSLINDQRIMI